MGLEVQSSPILAKRQPLSTKYLRRALLPVGSKPRSTGNREFFLGWQSLFDRGGEVCYSLSGHRFEEYRPCRDGVPAPSPTGPWNCPPTPGPAPPAAGRSGPPTRPSGPSSPWSGIVRLRLQVRTLPQPRLPPPRRPASGPSRRAASPCPQHEFGLDVIALVGRLRHAEHRSVPEIHAELARRGVPICVRSVGNLLDRYDELLALSLSDAERLRRITAAAGRVILAIDGLQPDVGHEVLWVLRDVPQRRGPAGPEPAVLDPGRPGQADRRGQGGAGGADRRGGLRRPGLDPQGGARRPSTACPTSSATSTTSARRPSRSTRPTATPRSS